jgi:hypothetical protein
LIGARLVLHGRSREVSAAMNLMRYLRTLTNQELSQALSHVHLLAHVSFSERVGDEMGQDFHDPLRPTVNRLLDLLLAHDPHGPCLVDGEAGSGAVVGALIEPEGVRLLLDRTQTRP